MLFGCAPASGVSFQVNKVNKSSLASKPSAMVDLMYSESNLNVLLQAVLTSLPGQQQRGLSNEPVVMLQEKRN